MDLQLIRDFALLPSHVIAQIFESLNFRQRLNAARTCKSWYYASCDPELVKHTRVRIKNNDNRINKLQRPFSSLIVYRVNFDQFSYAEFFQKFGQYITEVFFIECDITIEQLFNCLITMTNLISFTTSFENNMITCDMNLLDDKWKGLLTNLNRVHTFAIQIESTDCNGLNIFLSMMPNLKALNIFIVSEKELLQGCENQFDMINIFTRRVIDFFRNESFFNGFSKIKQELNLHELHLQISDYDEHFNGFCERLSSVQILSIQSIGERELNTICRHMTQISDLLLYDFRSLKVRSIGSLLKLETLRLISDIFRNEPSEDEELLALFTKLHRIKVLTLKFSISERVFNEICNTCTRLTFLELTNLYTRQLSMLYRHLIKLKYLSLSIWVEEDTSRNPRLTNDYDITNLIELEELEINTLAPGMTIELIEQLPKLQPASLLKIREKLQTNYIDPELERTYASISWLFD